MAIFLLFMNVQLNFSVPEYQYADKQNPPCQKQFSSECLLARLNTVPIAGLLSEIH
jgi:hypothetical protein